MFKGYILSIFITYWFSVTYATDLKTLEEKVSDSIISTKITAKYTKNPYLNPLKIRVQTRQHVVRIKGFVKNKEEFMMAVQLAAQTKGVKTVVTDDLIIKKVNSSMTDAYITAMVEGAILIAKVLDNESIPLVGINAKTVNGVVTVTGQVKNETSLNAVITRINQVPGVKKIVARISIAKKPV